MKVGISTASLFFRKPTEDAIEFLAENKVDTAEVFLESFCEYNSSFGKLLAERKKDLQIHSIHTLTIQLEPQLYSINKRAQEDSFKILEGVLDAGEQIGAKYYTFHGVARLKKTPINVNYERVAEITQRIIDRCKAHNMSLSYENVEWCYYNYLGFFDEIRKRTLGLKGVLDIKQARLSGLNVNDLIKEMGKDLVTVHISDIDENGKMCLPTLGVTDFYGLFQNLKDNGFNGSILLEVYPENYKAEKELLDSYNKVKEIANKVFN